MRNYLNKKNVQTPMAKKENIVKGIVTIRKSYPSVQAKQHSYRFGGQVKIQDTLGRGRKLNFVSNTDLAQSDIIELVDNNSGPLVFKRKIGHLNR